MNDVDFYEMLREKILYGLFVLFGLFFVGAIIYNILLAF